MDGENKTNLAGILKDSTPSKPGWKKVIDQVLFGGDKERWRSEDDQQAAEANAKLGELRKKHG